MKKILNVLFIFICVICLTGCGKKTKQDIVNKIDKKINNLNGYKIEAKMQIVNGEDTYNYDVTTSYQKKDNYRVSLRNTTNNHEQIILKNEDGVYVITPRINKSFKFQSNWPYNSSQAYILQSIVRDMKNDVNLKMKKNKDGYVFISKVNYRNTPNITYQKIFFDNNLNIEKITVYDKDNNAQIKVIFKSFDLKAKFKKNYFILEENMNMATDDDQIENTGVLDEAVYPTYLPEGTYLDTEKTVDLDSGSRIILTFAGDESFMLVEETLAKSDDIEIVPTSGDLDMVLGTIAIVDDTSVSWQNDGVSYYLVSSTMSSKELVEVAKSMSAIPISK